MQTIDPFVVDWDHFSFRALQDFLCPLWIHECVLFDSPAWVIHCSFLHITTSFGTVLVGWMLNSLWACFCGWNTIFIMFVYLTFQPVYFRILLEIYRFSQFDVPSWTKNIAEKATKHYNSITFSFLFWGLCHKTVEIGPILFTGHTGYFFQVMERAV